MPPPCRQDRLPAPNCCAESPTGVPSASSAPSCSTVMRSANSKTASMSCSTTTSVRPRAMFLRSCTVSLRSRGLMPASGSSSSSSDGDVASARPISSRRFLAVGKLGNRHVRAPCQTDHCQRGVDLSFQPRHPIKAPQKVERESAPPFGQRGDDDVVAQRQPGEELVHLIALGQPELTHAGDLHAGDVAAMEEDAPGSSASSRRSAF